MEIFIGALIVAGVAWIFVRHYGKKSDNSPEAAPYKVEAPATEAAPPVEQAAQVEPVDGRWPFPTSPAPGGPNDRVEATAPKSDKPSAPKARVKNTVKAVKEPKAPKTPKVVKESKPGKAPKMAKEPTPKATKAEKAKSDVPTLTVVDNKPGRSKK